MRIILHLDLDAFFAACEVREKPELKGKPVVIGADPKGGRGRGVVSTCNYSAREYGIHSGMPISQAHRLCPHAAFLPVNFRLYWQVSERVMMIARKYSEKFQQSSIDEAFLDVSSCSSFEQAEQLAQRLKQEISDNEGITSSIGIGENKLVAKIASDYRKPDGLTAVRPEQTKEFLFPLPVRKLYGVGRKTEQLLQTLDISTVGDLAAYDVQSLTSLFGKWGLQLHLFSNGIDESAVEEVEGIQSIGREVTFEEDTNDLMLLNETIDAIAGDIAETLQEERIRFRTVTLKVRFENFETHTRQLTLGRDAADKETLQAAAQELLLKFADSKKKVRLIGVRISNLSFGGKQKSLNEYGT
ncbi:MAG: DNA polymerase IV [Candidatus Aenigmarchaeota archaeon]|nr:DNA polymerase IV [Candidatus Aenigmarchaeota archaeon]